MHRKLLLLLVLIGVTTAAHGQLYDYSLIGQVTNDFWEGPEYGEYEIDTTAAGIQVGRMADDGFDLEWSGSVLVPLSLTFRGDTATLGDANFGAGVGSECASPLI